MNDSDARDDAGMPDMNDPHGRGDGSRTSVPALAAALDEAIAVLERGASPEVAAARYPDLADELRPLLEIVVITQAVAHRPAAPDVKARVRERVMAGAGTALGPAPAHRPTVTIATPTATTPWWRLPWLHLQPATLVATAIALTVLFSGTGGVMVASAGAVPGESLYAVKLVIEDTRVALAQATSGSEVLVALQTELCNRRLEEAQTLAQRGQAVPPELIVAATERLAAAEAVVGRAPAASRPQLQAAVAETQTRTEAVVARVIEQAAPQSQEAIQRALATWREGTTALARTRSATPTAGAATASPAPGTGAPALVGGTPAAALAAPAVGTVAPGTVASGTVPSATVRATASAAAQGATTASATASAAGTHTPSPTPRPSAAPASTVAPGATAAGGATPTAGSAIANASPAVAAGDRPQVGSATPAPGATATPPTATVTATSIPTGTGTATSTATGTGTASATAVATGTPTPPAASIVEAQTPGTPSSGGGVTIGERAGG